MWNDALPRQGITNWQTFYATAAERWQAWSKPAGCSWIYFYVQASGGGGGRPSNAATNNGGGGGGSGGTARMLIPAFMVPDTLYISPGLGGAGAASFNTFGSNGGISYVTMAPNTTTSSVLISQTGGSGGGGASTGGNGGLVALTNPAMVGASLFTTGVGAAGGAGASVANTNGASVTQTTSTLTTGGGGGGNGSGSGGSIINNVVFPTIAGGASLENGRAGFQTGAIIAPGLKSFPMIFSGGSGGGGISTAGTAGVGGDGSYGGGGGGGGGGRDAGSISGNGGRGGNGFILVGAF